MKDKNGFTLVELLAVIAILAILVIIALPNVINMYSKAQKETFLTEAKNVYRESEKVYLSNAISGKKTKVINSKDSSKLNMTGSKLQYCVILNNSGKVTDMKVSNGKWVASLKDGKTVEDLTIDDLEDGNLDGYNCRQNAPKLPEATNCTFDGDLVQGVEYVNGQYTYRYMQEFGDPTSLSMSNMNESSSIKLMNSSIVPLFTIGYTWKNMSNDGWGVVLTDRNSTEPVTSKVCTYINGKPITSMSAMFYNSEASSIDLSSFNTSNVTNMSNMFENSTSESLNLKNFDTSKVKNMNSMFDGCQTAILDLSNFDTSNVANMNSMFFGSQATILDVSSFDTSNVTDMDHMFAKSQATSLNLSSFNTNKVTNMNYMFYESQAKALDLKNFDTSKVKNMNSMFYKSQAASIDVSNFDTSKVTDMAYMFTSCQVTSLDLSSFDTSNVTNMRAMFNSCHKLKTIYASDKFVIDKVTDGDGMFSGSSNLVGGSGSKCDGNSKDEKYAHIDGGTSNPGYFTKK